MITPRHKSTVTHAVSEIHLSCVSYIAAPVAIHIFGRSLIVAVTMNSSVYFVEGSSSGEVSNLPLYYCPFQCIKGSAAMKINEVSKGLSNSEFCSSRVRTNMSSEIPIHTTQEPCIAALTNSTPGVSGMSFLSLSPLPASTTGTVTLIKVGMVDESKF